MLSKFKQYFLLEWNVGTDEKKGEYVPGEPIWIDINKVDYVHSNLGKHSVVCVGGTDVYLYEPLSKILNDLGV